MKILLTICADLDPRSITGTAIRHLAESFGDPRVAHSVKANCVVSIAIPDPPLNDEKSQQNERPR